MSDEKPDTPASIPDLAGALVRRLLPREALMLGAFTLAVGAAGVYATVAVASSVDERVDAGITSEARAREDLERRLVRHEAEEAQARLAQAEALREQAHATAELQADVRALYRYQRTGAPQERLERPADGGRP